MAKRRVKRPKQRKRLVRNQSSRYGAKIQAIAIHTTEGHNRPGRADLNSLFSWFNNPDSESSSHISIDDEAHTDRYVMDSKKAWTILQLNAVTLNIELVGFAATLRKIWKKKYRKQLKKTAKWIAYWSKKHDIPIRRGKVGVRAGYPYIAKTGVITHADLTRAGFGSHQDPGKGFPMKLLLTLAKYYARRGW